MTPRAQRYSHGDVEFVQVLDTTLRLVAGDVFPTLPADAALPGRDEVLSLPVFVYLVAGTGGWTVIDTGVGAHPPTGAGAGRLHGVPGPTSGGATTPIRRPPRPPACTWPPRPTRRA